MAAGVKTMTNRPQKQAVAGALVVWLLLLGATGAWGAEEAAVLDGVDDQILTASGITLSSSFTVAAWVYVDGGVMSDGTQALILGEPTGSPQFYVSKNSGLLSLFGTVTDALSNPYPITGVATIPSNQWVHVAMSLDGVAGELALYINGVLDTTAVGPAGLGQLGLAWSIGEFPGMIDDVRVYQDAINGPSGWGILEEMLNDSSAHPALVLRYEFDNATASIVPDLSASMNDGTLLNGATTTAIPRLTATQTLLDFGIAEVNTSAVVNLDVQNTGDQAATITGINFPSGVFTTTASFPIALNPLDSASIPIQFLDSAPAIYRDLTLEVLSDAPGASRVRLAAVARDTSSAAPSQSLQLGGGYLVAEDNLSALGTLSAVTLEAWFRLDAAPDASTNGNYSLVDIRQTDGTGAYGIGWRWDGANTVLAFEAGGTTVFAPSAYADGQWHHVAGVYDGLDAWVYVDGALVAESGGSLYLSQTMVVLSSTYGAVYVGYNPTTGNTIAGSVDEVRIWNVDRDQLGIQKAAYAQGLSPDPALKVYWNFDNDGPPVAEDKSGNAVLGLFQGNVSYSSSDLPPLGVQQRALVQESGVGPIDGIGAPITSSVAWTLSGWVRVSALVASDALLFGYPTGPTPTPRVYVTPSGNIKTVVRDASLSDVVLTGTSVIPLDRWTHVAAVWDSADLTLRIYINGFLDAKTTISSGITAGSTADPGLYVGDNWAGFSASYDEIRVWEGVALTQDQIWEDMGATAPVMATSLIIHVNFDDGYARELVTDSSAVIDGNYGFAPVGWMTLSATSLPPFQSTVNIPAADQTLTLTNVGTAGVSFDAVSFSGSGTGNFEATPAASLPALIGVNASMDVTVGFTPDRRGLELADLYLDYDGIGSRHVRLQGVGTDAVPPVGDLDVNTRLAVSALDPDADAYRIFALHPDGSAAVQIHLSLWDPDEDYPAWSPDGRKVAFVQNTGSPPTGSAAILVATIDGREVTTIATHSNAFVTDLRWSPNGLWIAYSMDDFSLSQRDLYLINADGTGTPIPLTSDASAEFEPFWSPDGGVLLFTSDRGGSFDIYQIEIDPITGVVLSNPELIFSHSSAVEEYPNLLPDGSGIIFLSDMDDPAGEVYRLDFATGVLTRLTNDTIGADWLRISPDGLEALWGTFGTVYRLSALDGTGTSTLIAGTGSSGALTDLFSEADWSPALPPLVIAWSDQSTGDGTAINTAPPTEAALKLGDVNNDGIMDLVLSGEDPSTGAPLAQIALGLGTPTALPSANGADSDVDIGDVNNDGFLDVVISGLDSLFDETLGLNLYDGTSFTTATGLPTGVEYPNVHLVDFDNDGDLDVFLTGGFSGPIPQLFLYRNDGEDPSNPGQPLLTAISTALPVLAAVADWADYDNDGDMDLFMSGSDSGQSVQADIWRNDGPDPSGTYDWLFTAIGAGIAPVQRGTEYTAGARWGDFDGDGDMDLAVAGEDPFSGDWDISVYRNDGGSFALLQTIPGGLLSNISVEWADLDYDFDLDLVIHGLGGSSILENVGVGFLPGSFLLTRGDYSGGLDVGDYNGDGRTDIFVTGGTYSSPRIHVWRNDLIPPNNPPTTPTGLSATLVDVGVVTFSWLAATDDMTSQSALAYNLRVGTTPGGSEIMSANITTEWGNVGSNTSWTLRRVPMVPLYWSVQAIDGGYLASAFAPEQTFTPDLSGMEIAATFDGNGDYLASPASTLLGDYSELTVEFWMRSEAHGSPATSATSALLVSNAHDASGWAGLDFGFEYQDSGVLNFTLFNAVGGSVSAGTTISSERWHHIAGVFTGSELVLYVDGVEVDRIAAERSGNVGARKLLVGSAEALPGSGYAFENGYFKGMIGEVRVWNRALSEGRILQRHAQLLTGTEAGLVLLWDFGGANAADKTTNGLDGSLFGDAWFAQVPRIGTTPVPFSVGETDPGSPVSGTIHLVETTSWTTPNVVIDSLTVEGGTIFSVGTVPPITVDDTNGADITLTLNTTTFGPAFDRLLLDYDAIGPRVIPVSGVVRGTAPVGDLSRTRLLFTDDTGIRSMRPDGTFLRTLTTPTLKFDPVWSPDGTEILYIQEDNEQYWIVRANGDGSFPRYIFETTAGAQPRWAPDGSKISFLQADGSGVVQVHTIDPDGQNLQQVTFHPSDVLYYSWSPDGSWLAYVAPDQEGWWQIYVVRSDGTGTMPLTFRGSADFADFRHLDWQADGARIFFQEDAPGYTEIRTFLADGSDLASVVVGTGYPDLPALSPDAVYGVAGQLAYWENVAGELRTLDLATFTTLPISGIGPVYTLDWSGFLPEAFAWIQVADASGTASVALGVDGSASDAVVLSPAEDVLWNGEVGTMPKIRAQREGQDLLRDILAKPTGTPFDLVWTLRVQVDPQSSPAPTLSWNQEEVDHLLTVAGNYTQALLTDLTTWETYVLSLTNNPIALTSSTTGVYEFELRLDAADTVPQVYSLVDGWNLLSLPGPPDDLSPLSEVAVSSYRWDAATQSWVSLSPFDPMPLADGFFLLTSGVPSATLQVDVDAPEARATEVTLYQGWNLIGAPAALPEPLPISAVTDNPNYVFTWDGAQYSTASSLEPGKGYWVYKATSGTQTVAIAQVRHLDPSGSGTHFHASPLLTQEQLRPDWSFSLRLETASGLTRTVELGSAKESTPRVDRYDIPEPPALKGMGDLSFTVRVEDYAKRLRRSVQPVTRGTSAWELSLSVPESATLRWDRLELPEGYRATFRIQSVERDLTRPGSLVIGPGTYRAQVLITWQPPEATRLLPNYPNPFNPETWIPFELEADADVQVLIYNAQGQLVRRLELGRLEAGYYTRPGRAAHWDGRNQLGEPVASGVYFYELRAGSQRVVRRMVLLK
ncbi:MAG: hypothetical protein KatS3mg115_1415 [Candidatus Poribacteria bacterium]|nr:MAG: hypothetical protein KatS3mg115_1415 [Candidatus Poribacteria bacterium]